MRQPFRINGGAKDRYEVRQIRDPKPVSPGHHSTSLQGFHAPWRYGSCPQGHYLRGTGESVRTLHPAPDLPLCPDLRGEAGLPKTNQTGQLPTSLRQCISIDPVNGKELDLSVNLNISKDDIESSFRYKKIPEGSIKNAFDNVIPIHLQIHQKHEIRRVVKKAFDHALSSCGVKEDQTLSIEQTSKVKDLSMTEILPLLLHLIGLNNKAI